MRKIYLAKNANGVVLGAFFSEEEAKQVSCKYGNFLYKTSAVQISKLFGNIKEYEKDRKTEVAKRALDKLTDEEKEALGLI